jgi:hypothetical protein
MVDGRNQDEAHKSELQKMFYGSEFKDVEKCDVGEMRDAYKILFGKSEWYDLRVRRVVERQY